MTAASLADTLALRFGAAISSAVMSALEINRCDRRIDLETVRSAICAALDAELLAAGAAFPEQAPISALAQSAGFRRAAAQAGVTATALDIEQRLCIDTAFLRRWRDHAGMRAISADDLLAQRLMVEVLIEHRG